MHLIRASLRYASKKDWTPLTQSLKPIYTAADEAAAGAALDAFAERWNGRYPAIVRLWRTHTGPSSLRSWPSRPRSAG